MIYGLIVSSTEENKVKAYYMLTNKCAKRCFGAPHCPHASYTFTFRLKTSYR